MCNTWKIQLTIAKIYISSMDNDEEHATYTKSDSIVMMNNEADEVIKELFDLLKKVASLSSIMFVYCIMS